MMKRIGVLMYGVVCYAVFFVTFLYAIGFVGNMIVPTTIDGTPTAPTGRAILIDMALLAVFALQHSIMARPGFKRMWTKIVPVPMERSTYTLFSSLALIAMFVYWEPIGGVVWDIQHPVGRMVMMGLFFAGGLIVLISTFLINHFDLFGLCQSWLYFRGKEYTPLKFGRPGPYKYIRHPLYVGWFMFFWMTPTMTIAHLVCAVGTTVYILIAIQFEERDLIEHHPEYEQYRKETPMFIPRIGRKPVEPLDEARQEG